MTPASTIAIIAVTQRGVEQANRLRRRLRAGEVHRPERYGPANHGWEVLYSTSLSERVTELFQRCDQMVFFLAVGAVTRLIAPHLKSKETDPGVLAVDEAGHFIIPLLSGHLGGANAFALTVAGYLGATPVITTASDVSGGLSLDLLAAEFGWTAEPHERLKEASLALVNGAPVAIIQEVANLGSWLDERELPDSVSFAKEVMRLPKKEIAYAVWITDRLPQENDRVPPKCAIWFRPRSLVLGVGCERGISSAALDDGLSRFLSEHRFARASIAALASMDLKADENAIREVAQRNDWPLLFYSAAELATVAGFPNPSDVVARCVGTPGVAEPAAMLASGSDQLLVEKQVMVSPLAPQRMTFALARSATYETGTTTQGKIIFVGAGPGDPDLLTRKAHRTIQQADVVVYAGSLVPEDILRDVCATAVLHNSAPLTLTEVMACMIPAARAGKRVVRLHSGDTSLYSAMQEQMTLLDEAGIIYEVIPGVSSFQAAAAALKAELTLPEVVQTIILTRAEGQTPMPELESLPSLAKHQATLCIYLSARLVDRVQEQLLTAYPADTPVAILYRVSWPDEKIVMTEVRYLAEEVRRHKFTRTTLIVVGTAVTRRQNQSRLYNDNHGHLFRGRGREETNPTA